MYAIIYGKFIFICFNWYYSLTYMCLNIGLKHCFVNFLSKHGNNINWWRGQEATMEIPSRDTGGSFRETLSCPSCSMLRKRVIQSLSDYNDRGGHVSGSI